MILESVNEADSYAENEGEMKTFPGKDWDGSFQQEMSGRREREPVPRIHTETDNSRHTVALGDSTSAVPAFCKAKGGELLWVWGQLGLRYESKGNLTYS